MKMAMTFLSESPDYSDLKHFKAFMLFFPPVEREYEAVPLKLNKEIPYDPTIPQRPKNRYTCS